MVVIIKYQWLLEYQELYEEIDLLDWKIKKSELELTRWVEGDLSNVTLERDSLSSSLEKNIERDKELLSYKEQSMESLMVMINRFKGIDNKILKMKYVDGITLDVVAEELNYSSSYIYKKHAELVRTIKFIETLT